MPTYLQWTPGGELIMLEGISMLTVLETPWGPFRKGNSKVGERVFQRTCVACHKIGDKGAD